MKRGFLFGFAIVIAAALGGAGGGAWLADWLAPLPAAEFASADGASGSGAGASRAPAHVGGESRITGGHLKAAPARPVASTGRTRRIAEPKYGPYRSAPARVTGFSPDGSIRADAVDSRAARKGFASTLRKALRQQGKAPKAERDARLTRDPYSSEEFKEKQAAVYPGDVFLSGIPMIDQGNKGYCAVASAARVLQGYGIEVTMEDMAELADSSETGGTNILNWELAIRNVASKHGLQLRVIPELTESMTYLPQRIHQYNQTAQSIGYDQLCVNDYVRPGLMDAYSFFMDREYPVQREVMLSDDAKHDAFNENVVARIDDSDPLFWTVTMGDIPEETAYGEAMILDENRSAHMRLIVGYNEDRGEVLYSDSWGEGHELKRMDACDALSITRGMYYLEDGKGSSGTM